MVDRGERWRWEGEVGSSGGWRVVEVGGRGMARGVLGGGDVESWGEIAGSRHGARVASLWQYSAITSEILTQPICPIWEN